MQQGRKMDIAVILKVAGGLISVCGTVLLAFRVSGLLKALGHVVTMHDQNILELARAIDDPQATIVQATNSTKWVEKAQKMGLLITGFGFLIVGALLQAAAAMV